MKYKAYLKQGDGCDYTIGCGQTVIDIEANDIDEATKKLIKEIEENYTGDGAVDICELYEISNIRIIETYKIYNQIEVNKLKKIQDKEDAEEKELYIRLKHKFSDI